MASLLRALRPVAVETPAPPLENPDADLCLFRNNYRENLGSRRTAIDRLRAGNLSRPLPTAELVRRQELCHLAMRGLERLDGAIQIKIGLADRSEEFGHQRQIEFNAGCAIAASATVERQMDGPHSGFCRRAATKCREFVISHPYLWHVSVHPLHGHQLIFRA